MRRRRPAQALRTAIDCLPLETRQAMLAGVEQNRIIVGAYVDRNGGVCPMLAAHRNGGRTSLASFARAWDRYTRAKGRPRPASGQELRTLRAMLEASIAIEGCAGSGVLGEAIADHRALKARRPAKPPRRGERRDTGERDRTAQLRKREGWAWLRPFRRLDEYERALREVEEAREAERELV